MWKFSLRRDALIILLSSLSLINVACTQKDSVNLVSESANAAPTSAVSHAQKPPAKPKKPKPQAKKPNQTTADPYGRAMDTAMSANTISQSAVSREDWSLVASRWQEAIKLLKAVPASSRNHKTARQKLSQYQHHLAQAQLKATPRQPAKSCSDSNPQFFSVPIKHRISGIPVVEVNFNDQQTYNMLFDTGASKTLITRSMASSLRLVPLGAANVMLANGSVTVLPLTKVKTQEIDGRLIRDTIVAVAPASMPIGLLGQEFYKGYDVTINEHVIEFHRQRTSPSAKKVKTVAKSCLSDSTPQFFSVPIKGREKDIPIVEVTFDNKYKSQMLFDTGASHTIITESTADKLGVPRIGTTQLYIADGSAVTLDLGLIKSQKMAGRIKREVPVAIAPSNMPIGLLGQDFYEGYNVTIKQNVILFRRRQFE